MTNFDLLDAVQPSGGWYAVVGIKGVDNTKQYLVETREEVDDIAAKLVQQQRNVFFGVAKYKDGSGRKKSNVLALKSFWLDIDCGPTKAAINAKTKKPGGYIDQAAGLSALQGFCKHVGLPKPTIVNSGRGLHVYWTLANEITSEEWEPVAARLRELCVTHDLYVDPAVFETARVLRIPNTYNFKDDPATLVSVITVGKPSDIIDLISVLGVKQASSPLAIPPSGRGLTALGKLMQEASSKSFSKIMRRSANGDGCPQLLDCYENRDSLSEARWFDALSIAKFCSDRDKAIHKISAGHPDYDPVKTQQKIAHIEGPHNCATFDRNNPGLCATCPHFGKIKNPIMLGKEVKEAAKENLTAKLLNETTGEIEVFEIPEYPKPFYWGEKGSIWKKLPDPEADPVFVYRYHLYVVKRMHDPVLRDVMVMRLHTPNDGVKEILIPNKQVFDKSELRKALAGEGVMCGNTQFNLIFEYIIIAANDLQDSRKAELMRTQFGWADNDSKFIIGDKEITADGVFYSPPSSTTDAISKHLGACGDYEKWQEVFNLYGTPGLEAHAFAALTAFGAPLFKFTGQSGAAINVIHPNSGTGKTTILHMCNSVWGHPKELCSTQKDTDNARILKLGTMNNLPYCVDEITNMSGIAFSDLIYAMSNGKGKDRMEASGNRLRANTTKWQTISLMSSNAAFYEKLTGPKATPDGEMMRMLEYKIDYSDALDVSVAKTMFDHQLMDNYGHAGPIYADWILRHHEEVISNVRAIQAKIDRELKLTQRERFWSAVVAANITGGLIAVKYLKIMNWDMQRIYDWATQMILALRDDVKPPATDVASVIGDYLNRRINNVLVVNDAVDQRSNMPMLPLIEPKGELLVRYEPDTKKMFIAAKPFKSDCVEFQVNYKETLDMLKKSGVYLGTGVKRLSKGMKVVTPGVYCLIFDTTAGNFLNMNELVGVPAEPAQDADTADAGGGS